MSWFRRDSPFRSSLRGKLNSIMSQPPPVEHDAKACFESFKNHWQQAWETMCHSYNLSVGLPRAQLADQISGVLNHLDQMLMLLLHDLRRPEESIGPLLDLVLTEDILNKLLTWSLKTGEFVNTLKLEQLKLYEMIITQSQQEVLVHKPILQPLLRLLSTCGECSPVEVEKRLVILLNQLCVSLTRNATLLEFFFSANCNQGSANFLIFSLLIPFVHREGGIGQQARDALLLCMSLSRKNDSIGVYIAEHSTFCPVLATGLSGLYSVLPRKLAPLTEDWHQFTPEDINEIEELAVFLNSLEFCNAVIQVSHPLVQDQLLEFLNHGFLLPVLVPALHPTAQQTCLQELSTATAYLDLFLRTITEPSLIQVFLKMLFIESSEGKPVIETLVLRIASQHPLCVITLSLFRTLLDLNCEDVMLDLVFKYLIPCTHVMVSQRCRVRDIDMFGKSAEKFLSLMPMCCMPHAEEDQGSSGPSSLEGNADGSPASLPCPPPTRRRRTPIASFSPGDVYPNYRSFTNFGTTILPPVSFLDYLLEARRMVTSSFFACQCWVWPYDGKQPKPEALGPSGSTITNGVAQLVDIESANSSSAQTLNAHMHQDSPLPAKLNILTDNDCGTDETIEKLHGCSPKFVTEDIAVASTSASSLPVCSDSQNSSQRELFSQCDNARESRAPNSPFKPKPLIQTSYEPKIECKNKLSNLPYSLQNTVLQAPDSPSDGFGSPDLGPFLSILLTKLENMMNNSVFENLQLTGLIARLACYPQPLLRSFLLNHSLVFQPSVRSLLQVLGTLKQKLDSFFYTVDNIDDLMNRARRYLNFREEKFLFDNGINKLPGRMDRRNSTPEGLNNKGENKRLSLTDRIFRRSPMIAGRSSRQDFLEGIPNDTGYRYVKPSTPEAQDGKLESLRTKNAVLCVVVLEEFLKELSAIAMEHAIVWEDNANSDITWQYSK